MDDKTREGLDRATARISAAFGMSTEAAKRAIEAQIELAGYGKVVTAELNALPAYKGNRHERRKQMAKARRG